MHVKSRNMPADIAPETNGMGNISNYLFRLQAEETPSMYVFMYVCAYIHRCR